MSDGVVLILDSGETLLPREIPLLELIGMVFPEFAAGDDASVEVRDPVTNRTWCVGKKDMEPREGLWTSRGMVITVARAVEAK